MSTKWWTTVALAAGITVATAGPATALLPSRTARGRALVGQVRGLLDHLHTAKAEEAPPVDREMTFSRSLPYAVVLGDTERRLAALVTLNPARDGSAKVYRYGGLETEHDPRRFGTHFPSFPTALHELLTAAGRAAATR